MKRRKQQRGFTLIEVMLAIILITLVIGAVAGSFQYAASVNSFAQDKITAANDAEKVMEEIRRVANASGVSGSNSASDSVYWTNWIAGQTFSGLPNETVSVTYPAGTGQDPLQVLVTVSWVEKTVTRQFRLYGLVTKRS